MPGLMVCGTTSDAGKSTVVTGLCRLLARRHFNIASVALANIALSLIERQSVPRADLTVNEGAIWELFPLGW